MIMSNFQSIFFLEIKINSSYKANTRKYNRLTHSVTSDVKNKVCVRALHF